MPLNNPYGVLVGTFHAFERAHPDSYGRWYHGFIYVDTPQGLYNCAVDVGTPDGTPVHYRLVSGLDSDAFAPIRALANGFHELANSDASVALDYARSPLLNPSLAGASQSYQWQLSAGDIGEHGVSDQTWTLSANGEVLDEQRWIICSGSAALDLLEEQVRSAARIYVFGGHWFDPEKAQELGMHDVHMNQGDPEGEHQLDDGVWQDGGTIVERPDGQLIAFLTKFRTQSFITDNQTGLPQQVALVGEAGGSAE